MSARVYLAARNSRREELRGYARQLEELGWIVTSRWVWGNHVASNEDLSSEVGQRRAANFAFEDWIDLAAAGLAIFFTEPPRSTTSRGGRHVEFGIALALGRAVWVVGPRENVFYCLPKKVRLFERWEEALEEIKKASEVLA